MSIYIVCPQCKTLSYIPLECCPACGANVSLVTAVTIEKLTGAILENRYQLVEYLDQGAMACVYRGVHVHVGSSVAVKILKRDFQQDSRFLERFQAEARAAGALNHPNILSIITVGNTPGGISYLISEFVQGVTLNKIIQQEGKLSLQRAMNIARQVLTALDEAHAHGIIHRDIKPENIMITQLRSREEFVKLLDFGIARQVYQQTPRLTIPGELFGTPEFMAPEVIRGQDASVASDLYAVGVVIYEMLTGQTPFTGTGIFDVLKHHIENSPVPLSQHNPEIPQALDQLILRALSKDPQQRPSSAIDFKFMLESALVDTSTVVCPRCNTRVQANLHFCPHCGNKMQVSTSILVPTEPMTPLPLSTSEEILYFEEDLRLPCVGREEELTEVESFLYGDRLILEISGPLGIGKTTFLTEVVHRYGQDAMCIYCGTDPSQTRRPWFPVRQLFAKLLSLHDVPSETEVLDVLAGYAIEPDDVMHIVQFLTLKPMFSDMERAVRLRERITSILRLLLACIGNVPHLFIFDDVHEYDYMSRMFIDRLVSVVRGFPLKVLVASEIPHIQPGGVGKSLQLKRLNDPLVYSLVLQSIKNSGDSYHHYTEQLAKTSMGLPLHVAESIHLLLEGGTELSSNLSDILQTRLRRLPPKAMRMLQLTTCFGDCVPLTLLQQAEGMGDTFYDALRVLIKRGFLRQDSDNPEVVCLQHPAYSRLIPAQMTPSVRSDFHAIILDYLEETNAPCHLLARHALVAGFLEQAIPHLECTGNVCEEDLDDYSAIENYKHAYDIVKIATIQGRELSHFAHLCAQLGDLYRYTGQFAAAEDVLKEGLLVCEDSPDDEAIILSSLARLTVQGMQNVDRAETLITRATRKARESTNPALLYRVYFDLSSIAMNRKSYSYGAQMLREGLRMVSSLSNSPLSFWRLFLRLAEFEFQSGQQEEAIRTLMNALNLGENQLTDLPKGRIHYLLGQFFLRMGRIQDAQPHIEKAVAYLQKNGDRQGAAEASLTIAQNAMSNREKYMDRTAYLSLQIGWKQGIETVETLRRSSR
mgnify:CR=1 FL=1